MANMHILISEETKRDIEKKAADLGVSVSAFVRMVLIKEIKGDK